MAHEQRLSVGLAVLVVVAGCYDAHGMGDADARSMDVSSFDAGMDAPIERDGGSDAPDAGLDTPAHDDDAPVEPCVPRPQVGVCTRAISTGTRLAVPFGNRGIWATVQSDRLVQILSRAIGTGFGVVSMSADLGEFRTEADLPAAALREDGVDFEILSYLGPADPRCTHWLAELVTRDASARRPLVFDADALPAESFRTAGAIADGAAIVASRATGDGRLLALGTTRVDLGACMGEATGYDIFVDEVALDGALTRIATLTRDGRAPLAEVARDDGFVVVDRTCADGVLEIVHVSDEGLSRVVPIALAGGTFIHVPILPAEGRIGALRSRRGTPEGLELSIEHFDIESGAAVGARQTWLSDAILATQSVLAVDREGNTFWAVTLMEGSASSDWLLSFPADGSAPTLLHLVDRGGLIDGSTRVGWWDGRLMVDTRTNVGFTLIEVVCGS